MARSSRGRGVSSARQPGVEEGITPCPARRYKGKERGRKTPRRSRWLLGRALALNVKLTLLLFQVAPFIALCLSFPSAPSALPV